jgi:hypothetical protein
VTSTLLLASCCSDAFWTSPVILNVITAVVTIFTLIWNTRSQRKAAVTATTEASAAKVASVDNGKKLDAVHTIVNGERSALIAKVAQLEAELGRRRAGE